MAKKIKFALKMADGAEVRTLDALKEHFDIESIVGYFSDGRLLNWLQSRYYDEETEKVAALDKDDKAIHKKLCAIFEVESEEEIDPEEIARRQERLNRLKQHTDDKEILERVDLVAFDQEDLSDLLDEDATLIYLCANRFVIPLRVKDKTYVGIGKAIAVIRSKEPVDFDALNIQFKRIHFDDDYQKILDSPPSVEPPVDVSISTNYQPINNRNQNVRQFKGNHLIKSPKAGTVNKIFVKKNNAVVPGDVLLKLDTKSERYSPITADFSGFVKDILVREGQYVEAHNPLIVLE